MLSIVVPCYNESLNLPYIFEAFKTAIGERVDIEVILVNNGSKDNSTESFRNLLNQYSDCNFFKVEEVIENKGYGGGILAGLKKAQWEVLAWTHADLQTDPSDVIRGYEKFLEFNKDWVFVKGKRTDRQFHAWFFSWGMQVLSSWALQIKLDDINAQPKVFSRAFYERYLSGEDVPTDFSLDLYAHYWAMKHCKLVEIPVVVRPRKFGEAKGGGSISTKIKLINRTFNYIFALRKNIKS